MLQTGNPACSHARIPPPSWYALPGALLSKSSALFRVLFPERQKKTTGLPEKRLSSPSPRSNASRGTSGQPGIARLRNSFSVRTSTKKAPPLRKSVMASCGDNVSNIGKTIRWSQGKGAAYKPNGKGTPCEKMMPPPKAEGLSHLPAPPAQAHAIKQGTQTDAPPSFTSGVRRTASALWSAGPSARFPAIFPAGSCR